LIEIVDESLDTLTPESTCCPSDQKTGGLPAAEGKKEEQKPEGEATRKRKRRRRHRKRFPKKSE
jgi:hypothetical protein